MPFLNEAFSTVPLSVGEWLTCLAISSLVLWGEELKKLVIRARGRGAELRAGASN